MTTSFDCTRLFRLMEASHTSVNLFICQKLGNVCIRLRDDSVDYYVSTTKGAEEVMEKILLNEIKGFELQIRNSEFYISKIKKALQTNVEPQ